MKGDPFPLLKEDMKSGAVVDWGEFPGGARGFATIDVTDQSDLFVFLSKYRNLGIRFTLSESVLSLDQIEKLVTEQK